MSEHRRSDESDSDFEDELIRAGKGDAPRRGARRKALLSLGMGAGGALGSSTTTTVAAASGTAATAGAGAAKWVVVAATKWVGLGVLAVGATAAAVHVTRGAGSVGGSASARGGEVVEAPATVRPERPTGSPVGEVQPKAPSAAEELPVPAEVAPAASAPLVLVPIHGPAAPMATVEGATAIANAAVGRPPAIVNETVDRPASANETVDRPTATTNVQDVSAPAEPPTASASEQAPSLREELATPKVQWSAERLAAETTSLESVRSALDSADAASALRRLDSYRAAFPHGLLEPESMALRVEAYLTHGDRPHAEALGSRFLRDFPRHPLAPHVRRLLGR